MRSPIPDESLIVSITVVIRKIRRRVSRFSEWERS
jgi:hypothetical protein